MSVVNVTCWFDKVDGQYNFTTMGYDEHIRPIERGYLAAFQQDRKLKFKDFELHHLGTFDTVTGRFNQFDKPVVLNPLEVWSDTPFNPDSLIKDN